MIRQLLRTVDWRALLVPAGAALLSAGVDHLERRRDVVAAELGDLDERVTFRREQLDGRRPLTDEPPAAEPAEPAEPENRESLFGWGIAAIAAAGLVVLYVVPRVLGAVFGVADDLGDVDELGDELGAERVGWVSPWEHAEPYTEPDPRAAEPAEPAPAPAPRAGERAPMFGRVHLNADCESPEGCPDCVGNALAAGDAWPDVAAAGEQGEPEPER